MTLRLLCVVALFSLVGTACSTPVATESQILREGPERVLADLPYDQPPVPETPPAADPTLKGVATWYGQPGQYGVPANTWYTRKGIANYAAAGPALRAFLGKPNSHFYKVNYPVEVCSNKTGRCVVVAVVDWCGCSKGLPSEKVIDLAPAVFLALGLPLSRGIMSVTIRRLP